MSRGPGAIERAILDQLSTYVIRDAHEIARDIYGTYEIGEEIPLTPAQIGSVRRALRRLAKRGVIKPGFYRLTRRTTWELNNPKRGKRWRKSAKPVETITPPDTPWRPAGAPIPLADAPVPYAASTRVLGMRRTPVALRRQRRRDGNGRY
jgi:hypothetical protein